ncbi:MAG: serine hydrolase [Roseivirga sp.]|nr:serine hydrolase [Roseivirga sp.]
MKDPRYNPLILLSFLLIAVFSCGSNDDLPESAPYWEAVEPAAVGLDATVLDDLRVKIGNNELGKVSSLVIIKDGKLAYESYFGGMDADTPHLNYSVTKSISAMAIGVLFDDSKIVELDVPILSFFPDYPLNTLSNPDQRKQDITLRQTLQMRAGFDWDELGVPYTSSANPAVEIVGTNDWIRYVLDKPLSTDPGSRFAYNSGCTMLLSGVINQLTGETASAYTKEKILDRLQITNYEWQEGPNEISNTGFGISLRPRDMAKIGQLMLNNGVWEGRQLLSGRWIAATFEPYTRFQGGYGYGYQWWNKTFTINGLEKIIPYAHGYGDQMIYVIKDLNMVVVLTGENYNGEQSFEENIIQDFVIPAAG